MGAAASGGRVGGLTLVGEAGPELVDFRRPAQVYSNDRLRQAIVGEAGTGVTVNQYFTVNSADSGAVERAMFDSLPSIVDAVKGAVNTDARRPLTNLSSIRNDLMALKTWPSGLLILSHDIQPVNPSQVVHRIINTNKVQVFEGGYGTWLGTSDIAPRKNGNIVEAFLASLNSETNTVEMPLLRDTISGGDVSITGGKRKCIYTGFTTHRD